MRNSFHQLKSWLLPLVGSPQPAMMRAAARYQRRDVYRHHPGQPGVEPTRFGDWEYNGRCTDFS